MNAVSPGPIATDFFARTGLPQEAIQEFGENILARAPLGRCATAEEVVVIFLLSSASSYVTAPSMSSTEG